MNTNKVAEVVFFFWVIKICATTLGETAGDLLSMTLNVGYALGTIILLSIFLVSLTVQMFSKRYYPPIFWMVILTTSTAGTTMSDYMDRTLELGYATGSLILAGCLVAILITWRVTLKSLSVSNIHSPKVELFYWAAILVSNTLGTALGDYLADDSGLGFFGSAALIGTIIGLIALASQVTNWNRVVLFWMAFVLTRPFGATFGDLLTKSHDEGGLGFGTIGSSSILAILLVIFVAYTTVVGRRNELLESVA